MLRRLPTRDSLVWLTVDVATALNCRGRRSRRQFGARIRKHRQGLAGSRVSALSTTSSLAATCPASELSFLGGGDMSSVWSLAGDEDVQLGQQAPHVVLAARQRLGEGLVDLLKLAEPTAVEQDRHRGQGLLGGGIVLAAEAESPNRLQLALRRLFDGRCELDVHRAKQTGLSTFGGAGSPVGVRPC